MIILLRAEFARLLKAREFYLSILFLVLFTLLRLYLVLTDPMNHFEDGFFFYIFFLGILNAVFVSMFVGSEHHYGTLRNKLLIGHTRCSVYLAELLVSIVAGWIIFLSSSVTSFLVGIPLFGLSELDLPNLLLTILGTLLISAVYSSLLVLLALLCQIRTVTAIIGLLLALTLFITSIQIYNTLLEPETYNLTETSPEGAIETGKTVPNPRYLTGAKRAFYLFLTDFLPDGQSIQISGYIGDNKSFSSQMLLYDILLILISSSSGIILFQKKDLK